MEELIEETLKQPVATSLPTDDEVYPPMCIETLVDPPIQHVCEEKEEKWDLRRSLVMLHLFLGILQFNQTQEIGVSYLLGLSQI